MANQDPIEHIQFCQEGVPAVRRKVDGLKPINILDVVYLINSIYKEHSNPNYPNLIFLFRDENNTFHIENKILKILANSKAFLYLI